MNDIASVTRTIQLNRETVLDGLRRHHGRRAARRLRRLIVVDRDGINGRDSLNCDVRVDAGGDGPAIRRNARSFRGVNYGRYIDDCD